MAACSLYGIESVAWDAQVTEALQEASGDVLEAAEELDGSGLIASREMLEDASHLKQLREDLSDL